MTDISLYSEPFSRTGNIAAEGFRNLLGRPNLGLLQTVIREAIQNSVDAAKNGSGPEIVLRYRRLSQAEADTLRNRMFHTVSVDSNAGGALRAVLESDEIRVFEICDFGTTGLAGPTRADAPADGPEDLDFVNFLRNVGAARDTHQGGGTYGYGKTSLYALSACSTILVDTWTTNNSQPVRRLMACQLGAAFDAETQTGMRRFTGRHWWGHGDPFEGVEPVLDNDAAALANSLGMLERTGDRTGTSIMMLAPRFSEAGDLHAVGAELVETVLWNFWPRLCEGTPRSRKLTIRIEVDGVEIDCPRPEEFPPLDLFARALGDCRSEAGNVQSIVTERPKRHLGSLSIRKGLKSDRRPIALREESQVPKQSCHIAVMRPVELVVKYIEGRPFTDERFEWAGVFICSDEDEVERAFAASEPPAHDDWVPENMAKGHAKTFVNVGLRRLREAAQTYANPTGPTTNTDDAQPSLAGTAAALGRILDNASPKGPGRKSGSGGKSRRKKISVSRPRFEGLELSDGGIRIAVFGAEITNDGSDTALQLEAEAHLVMDGGAANTDELPFDFDGRVSELALDGDSSDESRLGVGAREGKVTCRVPIPEDAAVGLRLSLIRGDEA